MTAAGFGLVAACLLYAALQTALCENLVHAVLWLGATLAATAVLFVMLGAPFLAGVQILLYVGGVMVLMVFGVMLTRRRPGPGDNQADGEGAQAAAAQARRKQRAGLAAAGLFGLLAGALTRGELLPAGEGGPVPTVDLARALFTLQALAFELLSLLLLAAMLGAIVIARRRDPGAEGAPRGQETP